MRELDCLLFSSNGEDTFMAMTRQQAWDLLTKYNQEPFHLRHAITVEHVMGWYARELGYGDQA